MIKLKEKSGWLAVLILILLFFALFQVSIVKTTIIEQKLTNMIAMEKTVLQIDFRW